MYCMDCVCFMLGVHCVCCMSVICIVCMFLKGMYCMYGVYCVCGMYACVRAHMHIHQCQRHPKGFPGGLPPQYWPGLAMVDCRVQMGSGIFIAVWPLAMQVRL